MDSTLGAKLFRAAELDAGGVDFWRSRGQVERWNYDRVVSDALLVAGALQQRGLRKGDRVAIVLPTHPDFYRAFFGVILAGAIPSALYPPVRLGRIKAWKERTETMLQSLSCRAVLTDPRLFRLMGDSLGQESPHLGCLKVEDLINEAQPGTYIERRSDDLAIVQFSSGATGSPKPIALTHSNVLSNANAILRSFPGDLSNHSGLSWLPLYHDMGLIGCLVSAMLAPGPITLIPPERFVARPRIWLEALTDTEATISAAPNFAFGLCVNRISAENLADLDLSNWRIAFCGAETVHAETLSAFTEHFAPVGFRQDALTPVYGLAEATLAVTMSEIGQPPRATEFVREELEGKGLAVEATRGARLVSLGQPVADVEVEIRGTHGRRLPSALVGKVCVRSPGVMQGYLDRPVETKQTMPGGWLDTGDRGFLYQGELYLCGRDKDIIIIRGRNYDPAQIEQSITKISGLRPGRAVALGCPDSETGTENLVVLAECSIRLSSPERSHIADQLLTIVQQNHNLNVSELMLLPPNALPLTSSGKIRRSEARRLWQREELPSGARDLSCATDVRKRQEK